MEGQKARLDPLSFDPLSFVADGFCGGDGLFVLDTAKPEALPVLEKLAGKIGNVAVSSGRLLVFAKERLEIYKIP